MRNYIFILTVLLASPWAMSQSDFKLDPATAEHIGNSLIECIYSYSVNAPLKTGEGRATVTYNTILQANATVSKFWDWNSFKKDSIIYFSTDIISSDSIRRLHSIYHLRINNLFTPAIYKNYPKNKITVTDCIVFHDYLYTENKTSLNWTLKQDTLTVCDYLCYQAICTFGGREWIAWYTPEISISDGPWKLYGLPGLILKAEDNTGTHCFEAVAIRNSDRPIYLEKNSSRYDTTKKQFEKNKNEFESQDPSNIMDVSSFDLKGRSTITVDGKRFVAVRPFEHTPLELE